jgi:hypothetical protein
MRVCEIDSTSQFAIVCTYIFTIGSILVRHAHAFYSSVQILQQLLSLCQNWNLILLS